MFIVIEPTEHHPHKELIELFFENVKNNSTLKWSFQNQENATFIISTDATRSIYGGAMLLKQEFKSLHKKIQESITNLELGNEDIWICTVFLRKKDNTYSNDCEFFFETFYRNLYKKLVEFGEKEKIDFLYLMLEPGEYFCTEVLGGWPYICKVKPLGSLKELSHGILSLKAIASHPLNQMKKKMLKKEIKLAA